MRKVFILIILQFTILYCSYSQTNHGGADWTPASGTVSGRHFNIGTFTVNSGVTLTVDASVHYLQVEAVNIVIAGTINANGAGNSGGNGGSGGAYALGDWGTCYGGYGGNGGFAGAGIGGGNSGTTGGQGTCVAQSCGGLFCIGDNDGSTAGGGGGSGGAGGTYGGRGGTGSMSSQGQGWSGATGGAWRAGGTPTLSYGTSCGTDITWGSGGGGAGGGGGGYLNGAAGGSGGSGGGMVSLISSNNTNISGIILCNGNNGAIGGNAAGQSIDNDWDCSINIGGFWQGSMDGYNQCGVCTYYNYDASGGAGGGGAGGSGGGIMIECNGTLNVTGTLNVEGGDGGTAGLPNPNIPNPTTGACNDWAQGGAGGGGGRIKIFRNPCLFHVIAPSSSFAAGLGATAYVDGNNGQIGTICNDNIATYIDLAGGTISLTDPRFCQSGNVPIINSNTIASGGVPGNYIYQWQYSTSSASGPFQDISGASLITFDPSVISQTTWYRRRVTSVNCIEYSNIVVATVNPLPSVNFSSSLQNQCVTSTTYALNGIPSGGTFLGTGVTGNNFNATNAGVGNFIITYTYIDGNGCSNSATNPITVYASPVGIISGMSPVCAFSSETYTNIGNTYTIANWTVSGGNITSGQGTNAIDVDWGNAGNFVISLTGSDGNGCPAVSPINFNVTINPLPIVTLNLLDSVCIDTQPYSLSGGLPLGGTYSGTGVSSGIFSPAIAGVGTHTITYSYTDANSCTSSSSVGTIVVFALPILNFPVLQGICGNAPSFTLNTATPVGGTYSGTGVSANVFNPNIAGTGTHTITYTYIHPITQCSNFITQQITVYPVPIANAGRDTMICYGASYTLQASGAGIGGSYIWDDGSTNPSRLISNLTTGTMFSVTATNSNNCSTSDMVILYLNPQLNISFTQSNATCFGFNNGSATAVVTGGSFPYTYLWNNAQITNPATNLIAGNYTVTVTDNSYIHCTISGSITITQPSAALSVVIDSTLISCNGVSDGFINTTVSGGTQPYTYLWNNNSTSPSLSNIASGIYTVTIADFQNCRLIRSINISQPNPLLIPIDSSNISCNGANDGWIRANVTGGTTPYRYLWNNGATGNMISNLQPGTYSVVVTDAHNCIALRQITITQPLPLQSNIYHTDVRCFGFNDGRTHVVASGGTQPYSYIWSNGAANDSIILLGPGSYSVTITDAHLCKTTNNVTINEPTRLTVSVDSMNILCNGSATGYIQATPSGGISPYTYLWNNGSANNRINNINAGLYIVTITDYNQCILVRNITLTEPAPLLIDMFVDDESCIEYCNGSIYADAQGGVRPYSYIWDTDPLQVDSIAKNLCVGTYTVKVIDFNNCFNLATSSIVTRTLTTATFIASPTEGSIPLTVSFTYTGSTASTFLWSFGDGHYATIPNPTHTYMTDSVFTASLTVTSNAPDLCHDTYSSQILIYPVSTLYVPNAFTPNGDNVNNLFYVKTHAIKTIEVYIYDRWGKLIHELHSVDDYWDGTINGEMAPQGVYVYSIRAKGYDDVAYRKMGRVTLIIK